MGPRKKYHRIFLKNYQASTSSSNIVIASILALFLLAKMRGDPMNKAATVIFLRDCRVPSPCFDKQGLGPRNDVENSFIAILKEDVWYPDKEKQAPPGVLVAIVLRRF
jgi:hypothetical protein